MKEEHETKKKISKIMKSYQSRLNYNDLPLRVIMYKCNHLFEFNPYTNEIRPFDSLIWYNLENEIPLYSFLSYIKKEYDNIAQNSLIESDIGSINGEILSIDLDKLRDLVQIKDKKNVRLILSFDCFMSHASSLYDKWKDIIDIYYERGRK